MFFKKTKQRIEELEEKISLSENASGKAITDLYNSINETVDEKIKEIDNKNTIFQESILKSKNEIAENASQLDYKVESKLIAIKFQIQKELKAELVSNSDNFLNISNNIEKKISLLGEKIGQFSLRYDNLFNELKLADERLSKEANEKGVTFKKYIDTCILSVNKTLEDTDRKLLAVNDKETSNYQQINKKIESAVNNFNSLYLVSDRKTGDLSKEVNSLNILKAEILNIKTSVQSNKDVSDKNLSSVEGEIKNLSLRLIDAKDIENKLNTKLCFLSKQIQYDVSAGTDKKMSDFKKDINEEYYKALQKIFEFNKKILEQAPVKVTDESIERLRKDLSQKLLEAKWAKQKAEDGSEIVSKGVEIINKRKELHEEMLRKEKQGGKVEGMKEQIKAFDWIIERVKK